MTTETNDYLNNIVLNGPLDEALRGVVHELRKHLSAVQQALILMNDLQTSEYERQLLKMATVNIINGIETVDDLVVGKLIPRIEKER